LHFKPQEHERRKIKKLFENHASKTSRAFLPSIHRGSQQSSPSFGTTFESPRQTQPQLFQIAPNVSNPSVVEVSMKKIKIKKAANAQKPKGRKRVMLKN
jgi:hypothetical protein